MSTSLAGGENKHGEVVKETFIESRKDIYFLFGANEHKIQDSRKPVGFMVKRLRSPNPR